MDRDSVQSIIDFIEENLKSEITANELADMSGYSMFHFYRIFQNAVGMPIMQYILRRRLLHAICEIGSGRKQIDVALEYGFDTYPGFYKSFVRELGYTPTEYLNQYKAKKPYRIVLSQEEHIMLNHKKITELLANWGMEKEKVSDVVFKETGEISDTAKYVGDGYVIKYTNNLANVVKAINISKALENVGLSSATVVPTKDGKEYVECGELYVFLSNRVAGEGFLASKVYLDEYEKKARFIGEIVGQLDLALAKIDVPVKVTDTYSAVCDWALPSLKDKMELPQGFVEEYTKAFEGLYKAIPRQIIHRDPNPSNIIVSGEKWGFIDFELSEENVRIFDPCYAATAILSETFEEGNEEKMDRWVSVLQQIMYGYDSVVRLSDEEKNAIPYIILANQFVATAWFAGMGKYQELYKTNVKMTEWIIRNFSKMQLEF